MFFSDNTCDHEFVKEVIGGMKTGDRVCKKCGYVRINNEEVEVEYKYGLQNLTKEAILQRADFPNDQNWRNWAMHPDVSVKDIISHMEKTLGTKF